MSDPVNLAINVGEKVCKEVGLYFKMKLTSTSLYESPDHGFSRKLVLVYSDTLPCYTETYTCT